MKRALITGCNGQDGSFLAEFLLDKEYNVYGISRYKATSDGLGNLKQAMNNERFHLLNGDVTDAHQINSLIKDIQPDEVYHLAAMSFVAESWNSPQATMNINVGGTLNILEACKSNKSDTKIYLACSSEIFGTVTETPQTENTPFNARSPYGVSKIATFELGRNYRDSYNMFVCMGLLYNHESKRRGVQFVTRKITNFVGKLAADKCSENEKLELGNLDAKRDWGSSEDYVEAMWLMLQQDEPDDFVIATGKQYSVREFCDAAFEVIGKNYANYIVVNPKYFRPAEVNALLGDATKAKERLGWTPKTSFIEMVEIMVQNDRKIWEEKIV